MSNAEVVNSFPLKCRGAAMVLNFQPLAEPVGITVTVYKDGLREIGCPFLTEVAPKGKCFAMRDLMRAPKCIHLYPIDNREQT